jgi:SAM-dependent methyltransferase
MASSAPPRIFSATRRRAVRQRRAGLQRNADAPRYVMDDMVEDVLERLAFLRHRPARALLIGDWSGDLARALAAQGCALERGDPAPASGETEVDEELPLPFGTFDLIVSLGTLDTVNDLPGALVHLRHALAPGGLMLASLLAAGSLQALRAAMLAGDGDRPAARLHPMVDVRAGGQLLQRTGFARPVVDGRSLQVRFGSLRALVADLRAQGLGNVLASAGPPLGQAALQRASAAFMSHADDTGRVTERFEIITLSGWNPA